tara:strand:+ start:148 stop:543 length:396 start_codon:yes stop_codon:yes gene_type:complete
MDNVETIENNEQDENPIKDLIKASLDKDYNHANKIFGEVMTIKMSDLLDQEKVKLADQIYNQVPEDEENNDNGIDDETDGDDEDIEDEALEDEGESDEVEESDESEEDIDDDEDEDESDDDEYDEVEGAAV